MNLGMHRVVIKLRIDDDRLYTPFKAGEAFLYDGDYNWLKANYPDSFIEIPMSEQEWMEYLSSEAHKSYLKAIKLKTLCDKMGLIVPLPISFDERTVSLGTIATEGSLMNPSFYGGGLRDVVDKALMYKLDVEDYEDRVFSCINIYTRMR